ncbi:SbcC/MukB-like Walker B domain-containing protein [Thermus antranikianii]|uniref:SbcC/MukB-like Walker B domain-containing protein n=1 Tax=Thermus antranikianii TaxID=88190 RepID=UPI0023559B07|nr:SbcC/MukB-like Walker B domain-containing protein [Thermus antranikianii]
MPSGRYSLKLGEEGSLEYEVYDAWTEVHRSVHTLSGGESFLASLALAFALSEELARRKLEASFLDEGYGTWTRRPSRWWRRPSRGWDGRTG